MHKNPSSPVRRNIVLRKEFSKFNFIGEIYHFLYANPSIQCATVFTEIFKYNASNQMNELL